MKFSTAREAILVALQSVSGVVERKQTMPVLANVLLVVKDSSVHVTGTDLEVELSSNATVQVVDAGEVTVPGRKLVDIIKALPEKAEITISSEGEKVVIRSGKSRFSLTTLPATDFPSNENFEIKQKVTISQEQLRNLLDKTHFSMAQQDVRYYLNGLLFELSKNALRLVATDGHRLALAETQLKESVKSDLQVILPRKGVLELQRILGSEGDVELSIGSNHMRVSVSGVRFTSKLIDGRFPDYSRVIPVEPSRVVESSPAVVKSALQRTAILANEKFRGIRLTLKPNTLMLQAHNPDQEEAEEEIEVNYQGEPMEIGFNINYLMDALSAIQGDRVELGFTDGNSSCLIRAPGVVDTRYVVMPMRL